MGMHEKFAASDGWLRNWKTRHGIRQILITGEKMSADTAGSENFKKEFPRIIEEKNLTLHQIFNFD